MTRSQCCLIALPGAAFTSCSPDLPTDVAGAYNALHRQADLNIHVKSILSGKHFKYHGPDTTRSCSK